MHDQLAGITGISKAVNGPARRVPGDYYCLPFQTSRGLGVGCHPCFARSECGF